MPKEIVSAEEILGQQSTEVAVAEQAPVAEVPAPKESEAPPAGFEDPPKSEEPAAPSAADVLAAAASGLVAAAKAVSEVPAPELGPLAKPAAALEKAAVEVAAIATEAAKVWRFVKNIHPGEKIFLKDGTEYSFPKTGTHQVTDPTVAQKLLEVADRFHIVLQ